ncbi:MAG TPA: penicillin-binding protein [Marmoricola sp.]|nr:penicillin-binding protein [Marmoricola sp.]
MSSRHLGSSVANVLSHLGVMVGVAALMGALVAGLAIPFAAVAGFAARNVADTMDELPTELTAEPLAQRTRVLAADGSLLATWYRQNRVNVPLNEVSLAMRKAIVAIEDYRFYQHGALDLKGTLRAFITNQASSGVVQGGSSITQQMVKQTLINQAEGDEEEIAAAQADTYERKIRELRYAIAFEQKYSKDWILERYLNVAYFGDGAWGIESAAQHYFSRPAKKLKLRQAAMLAGIVKNPTQFDPTNNPVEAKQRRNVVLARMADLNVISMSEARKASRRGLGLHVKPTRNGCLGANGEFFCDYVREYLMQDPALGRTKEDREQLLEAGGLTIETTIDPRMQRAADSSLRERVNPTDQAIGGLAMVEPGTGRVKALAQSRPMGADKSKGRTYLNYVVPKRYGDANGFQAGSTFKVFVLAAAIKQGIALDTRIDSPPSRVMDDSEFTTCEGPYIGEDWSVSNSTSSGVKTLYTGTRESVNTFFAELESRTGLCDPITMAEDMGIVDPDVVPSFTLGVTSTDPLTMAAAYGTFAARGEYCEPRPVERILSSSGKVIADYPDKCQQLMPSAVADAVNDILAGVQEPGGFGYDNGLALSQPSAAKTGTIDSNMAVWYVGYTPNLATAAMLAGANSLGHWITLNGQYVGGQYIDRAFGSTYAGPIWAGAMQVIDDFLPDAEFTDPDPTAISGQPVDVPSVSGLDPADAAVRLREAGFVPSIGSFVRSTFAEGMVAETDPVAGAKLGTGSPVTIFVSNGKQPRGGG